MSSKNKIVLLFLTLLGVALILGTNPAKLPLAILVVPFVLVFILSVFLALLLIDNFSINFLKRSNQQRIATALILAAFPTFCLTLQSIGQLSLRDFVTLTILTGLLLFYVSRSTKV